MSRSLRVALRYIEKMKSALGRNGFPSQKKFAEHVGPSLSTVKKFLKGEPVDFENFVELCEALDLDWQNVADKADSLQPPDSPKLQPDRSTSPFITGTPIDHPRYFFGRHRELRRLFGLLKNHPLQNAAIIGQRRSGKTSLLKYLQRITTTPTHELRPQQKSDWLPHPETYRWVFVDFQDSRMKTLEGLLGHVLVSLGMPVPNPCNLDGFMDALSGKVRQPTVILLDEVGVGLQRCPELDDGFWESLRSLATHQTGGNLAFILATPESPLDLAYHTGHSSPFFNIFGYTTTLGALTETAARELIASSPMPLAEADVAWILQQSGRMPLLLEILCRERLVVLEEGEAEEDWQAEGLRQIQPFRHLLVEG